MLMLKHWTFLKPTLLDLFTVVNNEFTVSIKSPIENPSTFRIREMSLSSIIRVFSTFSKESPRREHALLKCCCPVSILLDEDPPFELLFCSASATVPTTCPKWYTAPNTDHTDFVKVSPSPRVTIADKMLEICNRFPSGSEELPISERKNETHLFPVLSASVSVNFKSFFSCFKTGYGASKSTGQLDKSWRAWRIPK